MIRATLDQELRRRTRSAHRATEAALLSGGWLSDPARYRILVGRLFGFHGHLEAALQRWPETFAELNLAARSRGAMLAEDLAHLGVDPPPDTGPVPLMLETPSLGLGALYVVEGSTLGGSVVAAMLQRNLGLDGSNGAGGFVPYGEHTAPQWQSFVRFLQGWPKGHDAVVQGATRAFGCYSDWVLGSKPLVEGGPLRMVEFG